MSASKPTMSVIIPTYNRPDDLERTLRSIAAQTRLPEDLLVVDDGDLPAMPHRELLESKGVHCRLERKEEKGLTRSRNFGVEITEGEIIAFFDDDVELQPDYLEELERVYVAKAGPELGGVAGMNVNESDVVTLGQRLQYLYDRLFLIVPRQPGMLSESGFSEQTSARLVFRGTEPIPAEILSGAMFSFHRRVFEEFQFDESYSHGYCQGEDKDFSLRVASRFKLYIAPKARLQHFVSPVERVKKFRRGRDYVLSMYSLFRANRQRHRWQTPLFLYSLAGYSLKRLVIACLKWNQGEWSRMRGLWVAAWHIISGQVRH